MSSIAPTSLDLGAGPLPASLSPGIARMLATGPTWPLKAVVRSLAGGFLVLAVGASFWPREELLRVQGRLAADPDRPTEASEARVARVLLDPQDAERVRPGQVVRLRFAGSGRSLSGVRTGAVREVAPDSTRDGSGRRVRSAVLDVADPFCGEEGERALLPLGVRVAVEIVVGRETATAQLFQALLRPREGRRP